ncbi:hypothetical protein BJ741DRAFT_613116 [Chytriomyces cf. hyalinus JEL632]|nr:hypothetical protein BJ741DRAFT_613116 [Chytriomyces cf. hyalinus JEL632]
MQLKCTWLLPLLPVLASAQLSESGCRNLRSAFTSFGFSTTPITTTTTAKTTSATAATTGSTLNSLVQCGCSFAVSANANQIATATCGISRTSNTSAVFSVLSLSISNPPITLGSLPAVLAVSTGNAPGFEWLSNLSLTNNALRGNALMKGEQLPTRTANLNVSFNPTLRQFPGLGNGFDENSLPPFYSFLTVDQTGNPDICCPPSYTEEIPMTCIPEARTCTGRKTDVASPDLANPNAQNSNSSSVDLTMNTASENSETLTPTTSTLSSDSIPSNVDSNSDGLRTDGAQRLSTGLVIAIVLASVITAGALLMGGYAYVMRERQKPVVMVVDEQEQEWGQEELDGEGPFIVTR